MPKLSTYQLRRIVRQQLAEITELEAAHNHDLRLISQTLGFEGICHDAGLLRDKIRDLQAQVGVLQATLRRSQ